MTRLLFLLSTGRTQRFLVVFRLRPQGLYRLHLFLLFRCRFFDDLTTHLG